MTSLYPVRIPDELLAAIAAHAREAYPHECCGYLRGADGTASELIRCRNAQADGEHPTHPERGAETGFVIAGRELFEFARAFGSERPPLVVYHSHTNGRAYLSAVDRANATADVPNGRSATYLVQHLVIGVTTEGVTEIAMFAWDAEPGDFVEVARIPARC